MQKKEPTTDELEAKLKATRYELGRALSKIKNQQDEITFQRKAYADLMRGLDEFSQILNATYIYFAIAFGSDVDSDSGKMCKRLSFPEANCALLREYDSKIQIDGETKILTVTVQEKEEAGSSDEEGQAGNP